MLSLLVVLSVVVIATYMTWRRLGPWAEKWTERANVKCRRRSRLMSVDAFQKTGGGDASRPVTTGFDEIAKTYDENFCQTSVGAKLRRCTWEVFDACFVEKRAKGQPILELSCGTGEDTAWLASKDVDVVATDFSQTMIDIARQKCKRKLKSRHREPKFVRLDFLDFKGITTRPFDKSSRFGGAFSNFGALNNVSHEHIFPIAKKLAYLVVPGGSVVVVIMGRVCIWEIAYYLFSRCRCDVRRAFRRLLSTREGIQVTVGSTTSHVIYFHGMHDVERAFCASGAFRLKQRRAIGLILPPSLWSKRMSRVCPEWALCILAAFDRALANTWPFVGMGDHFLLEFERV